MQSVEIYTSQNVAIDYELATLRDRLLAFLLDSIILWVVLLILNLSINYAFGNDVQEYLTFLLVIPVFLFYSLSMEITNNGQSVGKLALGIRVVKINGKELNIGDCLIRWVFRMVDIYLSGGAIAVILISASDKNQRLGDLLGGTTIIKTKSNQFLSLNSLLEMYNNKNIAVTYPAVTKFKEQDMLLIKEVLERHALYNNKAHREALNDLAGSVCKQLSITKEPKDKQKFLRTVLHDYIILTR